MHRLGVFLEKEMATSVTAEFLLTGYALALEQCGVQFRDAVLLYENGSYANAVVMAAFAREELGRSLILLDFWRKRMDGSPVTVEEIDAACDDHEAKQRAGMLGTTIMADRDSSVGKILTARMKNHPESREWQEADATLNQITDKKNKRTPADRHEKRMSALYVEPKSGTEWNRPADTSAQTAHDFLQEAVNDYRGRYLHWYITSADSSLILKETEPKLYQELKQLPNLPALPAPVSPSWPQESKNFGDGPGTAAGPH
jgi:AbiV family abortive infection protein